MTPTTAAPPIHPVRAQRLRQGISQEELAARTGLTRETVSRVEGFRNCPTRSTLTLLGMGLGVDSSALRG